MCIIWPQRLAVELNVISCITCPCFKSLVPGSGRKAAPLACSLFCLAVVQLPGLQASSEWNLKRLVKQTVVYISGSIFMSNYRMIFCTGRLVRLPRCCILHLKAGTCVGYTGKEKSAHVAAEWSESLSDCKQCFIRWTIAWNRPLAQVKQLMNERMIVNFTQLFYIFLWLWLNDAPLSYFPAECLWQ